MKGEHWQQVQALFHEALKCPPEERAAFLERACGGDEGLRQEVFSLLAAHEQAASFIEEPLLGSGAGEEPGAALPACAGSDTETPRTQEACSWA